MPVNRKAACQLKERIRTTTSGWAIIELTPEPMLMMPMATVRSFGGNHWETVLAAAGKFSASPTPSTPRKKASERQPLARAVRAWATDHQARAAA
ncbi:MAG TPA: hypothetical protein VFG53_04105 [Anaeromyxobacter sp.]|nr:hypothetical protein [Anaeromyxobacter sp.]